MWMWIETTCIHSMHDDWLDMVSTPNSIFMSISVQFWVDHARSSISNTAIVVLERTSSSTAVIVTPDSVIRAARIWSSVHWGSWLASSFNSSMCTQVIKGQTWFGCRTRDQKVTGSTPGWDTIKSTRSSQPSIPPVPAWLAGVSRGAFTCVGWQVTLCDPIWQVTSRSSEVGFSPGRAMLAFNNASDYRIYGLHRTPDPSPFICLPDSMLAP